MTSSQYVNISILGTFMLVLLIILISTLLSETRKMPQTKIFISMTVFTLLALLSDLLTVLWEGNTAPGIRSMIIVALICLWLLSNLTSASIDLYMLRHIRSKAQFPRGVITLLMTAWGINLIFTVIILLTNKAFVTSTENTFSRGPYYYLTALMFNISILYGTIVIVRYRKAIDCNDFVTFLLYEFIGIMLPLVPLFITLPVTIDIPVMTTALTIILIYVRIQSEQGRTLKQQELKLKDAQIAVMLSQIQPHFLYNTLTTIKNLIGENPAEAKELVSDFSVYLRENMDSLTEKRLIDFRRELENIRVYLKIEKARFEERLNVKYIIEATDFLLPMLAVQPLVENAVRHGITKKKEGGTVTITSKELTDYIEISVIDDGVGFYIESSFSNERAHIGINNVRQRLASQCGGELTVESEVGKGTVATIKIPKKRGPGT